MLVKSGSETTPLNELVIGFVQGTAGETRLKKYIDAHETKVERTLIDRLKGRTPELPADAIVFTTKAFASYPELFDALARGTVAGAAVTRCLLHKICGRYICTRIYPPMKQVSAMSNMQSPQLRTNPPLLSLRNCSSMTCKKAVNSMHCLKNTDFDSSP